MKSTKPATGTTSRILVSRTEAAAMLSINPRSVAFLIENGSLPSVRVGKRSLLRVSDLHSFAVAGHPAALRPAL